MKLNEILSSLSLIFSAFKRNPEVAKQRAEKKRIKNQIRAKKAERKLQKLQKKIDKRN